MTRAVRVTLLLAGLAALATPVAAQDPSADMIARAKALAGDKPFSLIVRVKVKPDGVQRFEAAAAASVAGTRREPGNVAYELHRDLEDAGTYYFLEKWKNAAAMEAHLKADYVKALLAVAGEVATEAPQVRFTAVAK